MYDKDIEISENFTLVAYFSTTVSLARKLRWMRLPLSVICSLTHSLSLIKNTNKYSSTFEISIKNKSANALYFPALKYKPNIYISGLHCIHINAGKFSVLNTDHSEVQNLPALLNTQNLATLKCRRESSCQSASSSAPETIASVERQVQI